MRARRERASLTARVALEKKRKQLIAAGTLKHARPYIMRAAMRARMLPCGTPEGSEDLDTDTEIEPVEDMTLETRSRC
ncbi:hypothetical protein KR032_011436 [Drosophila birchii]|nr:hypothetical protein KR032_011436 [Drosophila birchii]